MAYSEIKKLELPKFSAECFTSERLKQAEENDKWEKLRIKNRLLDRAGLMDSNLDNFLSNFKVECETQRIMLENANIFVQGILTEPRQFLSLILFGNPGSGKTHLATAIAREICQKVKKEVYGFPQYFDVWYTKSGDIVSDFKEAQSYSKDKKFQSTKKASEWYGKQDLLVIDEIGRNPNDKNEGEVLFSVIDKLRENKKALIICTNFSWEEFTQCIGRATISRLLNNSLICDTSEVKDYRMCVS